MRRSSAILRIHPGLRVPACVRAGIAFAVLAGCAQLPQQRTGDAVEFEIAGRIAVRYRDEASSGQLNWRHGPDKDHLLISSPLGQGVAQIERDGQTVTLKTAEGRELQAQDAETLTERALGFRIPLAGLADWVRGRPARRSVSLHETRDAEGRLALLEQDDWRIEYLGYQDTAGGALPAQLRLSYPAAGPAQIELRLAISEWRLAPRSAP